MRVRCLQFIECVFDLMALFVQYLAVINGFLDVRRIYAWR